MQQLKEMEKRIGIRWQARRRRGVGRGVLQCEHKLECEPSMYVPNEMC